MSDKTSENATENPEKEVFDIPGPHHRQPWETSAEYQKFLHFLHLPPGRRSVRTAYKNYCEANGIKARKSPPSSWYQLYNGKNLALRRLMALAEKIEAAQAERGEIDFERLNAVMIHHGALTGDDWSDYQNLVKYCCWALGLDEKGDPIPDCPSWAQIEAADESEQTALLAKYQAITKEYDFYK